MSFRLGLAAILRIVRSVPPLMGEKSAYREGRTEGGVAGMDLGRARLDSAHGRRSWIHSFQGTVGIFFFFWSCLVI